MSQWDVLCTTNQTGKQLVTKLYNDLVKRKNIALLSGTEVISYSGNIGDFNLKIKITPRFIKEVCDEGNLQKAIEACPVEIPDEFNFNITNRKAIYHNFPSEYPHYGSNDIVHCT